MALEIKNITKTYDRIVLDSITHSFDYGRLYVIKGVSGCGKTTLLNILGGLDSNFEGQVLLDGNSGKNVLTENIGYIFQQSLLISDLTVKENLLLINDDHEKIDFLTQQLGINELLDQFPSQISGGERQRVSIFRALLAGVNIILADEPTSSLDDLNSHFIAELLSDLCKKGYLVIVATHEHYFDPLADEIIQLDYGKINDIKVPNRRQPQIKPMPEARTNKKHPNRVPIKIVYSRGKRQWKLRNFVPAVMLALLIMSVSTLANCTDEIFTGYLKQYYPQDIFPISEKKLALMDKELRDDITVYYPYTLEENDVKAFYYAEKKDSVLAAYGMIKYGHFPESKEEILVSYEYAESKFGAIYSEESIVGRTVLFAGREFTISGCLRSFENDDADICLVADFSQIFDSDRFYFRNRGNMLFLDYSVISEIGKLSNDSSQTLIASYDGLMQDHEVRQKLLDLHIRTHGEEHADTFVLNNITNVVNDIKYGLDIIVAALYLMLVFCFMIACVFIRSKVNVELHYRSREIGFLQIFKVSKKKLKKMLLWEYLVQLGISLCASLTVYFVLSAGASVYLGEFITFHALHIAVIFAILLFLYINSLLRCIKKQLKKDIISLINK